MIFFTIFFTDNCEISNIFIKLKIRNFKGGNFVKKIQVIIGIALAILTIVLGSILLEGMLLFRLFIGAVIGYALVRGAFGFAGSVNRAYRNGSTKLIRAMMFLFVISAIGTAVLLFGGHQVNISYNPINLALILGAFSFGIGMALASCCASGVLQNLSGGSIKYLLVLFFFGAGVFFASPLKDLGIYTNGEGINFIDWFKGDFAMFGALLVVLVLALVVTYIALFVERKLKDKGLHTEIESESAYKEYIDDELPLNPISEETYKVILGNPWSLKTAAIVIAFAFVTLMIVTGGTWGISGVFGTWFAKLLSLFGVSTKWLAEYSGGSEAGIIKVFSTHPISIQDMGIFLGAIIATLTMAKFSFKWRMTWKQAGIYALGGLLLGLGITLGRGCNAGGLFSPIATFSLSGWIYLVLMVSGAILGNYILKNVCKIDD
jgi:hypothetical protein